MLSILFLDLWKQEPLYNSWPKFLYCMLKPTAVFNSTAESFYKLRKDMIVRPQPTTWFPLTGSLVFSNQFLVFFSECGKFVV